MTNLDGLEARRARGPSAAFIFLLFAVFVPFGAAVAADFTVVNKCSYTVFPGIFPATYQNGGWQMA
jgi:hypothetical protein